MLLATYAMGTRFELALPDGGSDDAAHLRAIGEEALREVERWHGRLSRFEPGSVITGINRDRRGRVDPETFGLLQLCERVRVQSGGAFDVTLGACMERLGFHPAVDENPETRGRIAGTCGTPGVDGLHLDPAEREVALSPGASLDLGAVAKGFALDLAAAVLREHGISDALLHGGTSAVVALGLPGRDGGADEGWPVVVRSDAETLTVHLRDQCLGVSAPRGRRSGGHSHILDPMTGLPVDSGADTAAVIGPLGTGALCDAWSTALVVLAQTPDEWPAELVPHIHTPARGWIGRAACLTELA